ncbi:hypothetical protein [Streptomyces cavernae]|uniref:hypothetical protein n=1 Tax=Streptomyces cavernae TaxID=2259034 RepID=UPI000FEC14CE|nr:hypothetical protein [Streptomyces cavernae]
MRRTHLTRPDGGAILLLEPRDRPRPGLSVRTAGNRLVVTQGSRPVLFAVVEEHHEGVEFVRTEGFRPVVPPLRARAARESAGSAHHWAHRVADALTRSYESPLHDGRWILSPDAELARWNHGRLGQAEYWSSMVVEGHPEGYLDWYGHNVEWEILPLRRMPDADDGRVKSYRKQAREGIMPPVVLWWVSGLDCHLVLDGHARLAAAIAESLEPPLLELYRSLPADEEDAATRDAVAAYEAELARFTELSRRHPGIDGAGLAGPSFARRLDQLRAARRPSWAWPLSGGRAEWERLARECGVSLPRR